MHHHILWQHWPFMFFCFFLCILEWVISKWMEQASHFQMTRETDRQTDRPENLTCHWSVLFLDVQEMMHAHNTVDASQCIVWTLCEHEFLLNIFHSLLLLVFFFSEDINWNIELSCNYMFKCILCTCFPFCMHTQMMHMACEQFLRKFSEKVSHLKHLVTWYFCM